MRKSHPPKTYRVLLRLADFDGFLRDRAGRLLNLIEQATGKQVTGRDSDETIRTFAAAV